MSAMNSVAIVEAFRDDVPGDVSRVKARFGDLIRESIRVSSTVKVPKDLEPSGKYDSLRRGTLASRTAKKAAPQVTLTDELVSEAADLLFSSYD